MPSASAKSVSGIRLCVRDQSPLKEIVYESEKLDVCEKCGGIWCDSDELVKIVRNREVQFNEKQHSDIIPSESHAKKSGITAQSTAPGCLKCAQPLQQVNYSYSSGIIIDRCPKGHGVWLDKDEIEKVQIFVERWQTQNARVGTQYGELLAQARIQTGSAMDKAVWEGRLRTAAAMRRGFFGRLFYRLTRR